MVSATTPGFTQQTPNCGLLIETTRAALRTQQVLLDRREQPLCHPFFEGVVLAIAMHVESFQKAIDLIQNTFRDRTRICWSTGIRVANAQKGEMISPNDFAMQISSITPGRRSAPENLEKLLVGERQAHFHDAAEQFERGDRTAPVMLHQVEIDTPI